MLFIEAMMYSSKPNMYKKFELCHHMNFMKYDHYSPSVHHQWTACFEMHPGVLQILPMPTKMNIIYSYECYGLWIFLILRFQIIKFDFNDYYLTSSYTELAVMATKTKMPIVWRKMKQVFHPPESPIWTRKYVSKQSIITY